MGIIDWVRGRLKRSDTVKGAPVNKTSLQFEDTPPVVSREPDELRTQRIRSNRKDVRRRWRALKTKRLSLGQNADTGR